MALGQRKGEHMKTDGLLAERDALRELLRVAEVYVKSSQTTQYGNLEHGIRLTSRSQVASEIRDALTSTARAIESDPGELALEVCRRLDNAYGVAFETDLDVNGGDLVELVGELMPKIWEALGHGEVKP